MGFKDHFSGHAADYAAARPDYPASLFAYLADLCAGHDLAWDCATGNGQAARPLAAHFARVLATDASAAQIAAAEPTERVEYQVAAAEEPPAEALGADLVTVAQALHWFDLEGFLRGVDRVLKPGGVLGVWSYGIAHITPAVDRVVALLYDDILGPYWPPERRVVERGYSDIVLPYKVLTPPAFEMRRNWTLPELQNYLLSWSSTQRYLKQHGKNPLELVASDFAAAWGDAERLTVVWPLALKVSRRPVKP